MPGTAILNPDVLLDDLIQVADEIRGDLHPELGVRQWEVYSVVRTWSGARVGEGRPIDARLRLVPQPLVRPFTGYELELKACGLDEAGIVRLEEVSLSYTEAELTGGALAANQTHFFEIVEAHGQATTTRYFVNRAPPYPDRVETIGWILTLDHTQAAERAAEEPMPIVLPGEALYDDLGAMDVNGSVTPVDFDYIVPAGKRAVIQQANFVVRCAADPTADGFGNLSALANGLLIQFLETSLVVLLDPLDGGAIRRNEDWALLGGAQTVLDVTGDMVLVEWFLPTPIALQAAQRLRLRVRDDLTALDDFRLKVMGYLENA